MVGAVEKYVFYEHLHNAVKVIRGQDTELEIAQNLPLISLSPSLIPPTSHSNFSPFLPHHLSTTPTSP
jgi:hypothetical protein